MAQEVEAAPPPRQRRDEDARSQAAPRPETTGLETNGAEPKRGLSPRVRILGIVVAAIVILGGVLYWLHARNFEETDDAQIDGHLNPISSKVDGTVLRVSPEVQDNHLVHAGDVLVEIDPATYQAELDRAQAEVARLQATAAAAQAQVPVTAANATGQLEIAQAGLGQARDAVGTERANLVAARAKVQQAEAIYRQREADRARYEKLIAKQEVSRSEYGAREAEARTAQAALEAARADVVAAENRVRQAESKVTQQQADVLRARSAPEQIAAAREQSGSANAGLASAQAQLAIARLNLDHTKIIAPVSGLIGRSSVEVGQRVQTGQPLFTIIQTDDLWVTANFKETQLENVRPGQPATVHVDTYNRDYNAKVESLAGATGARFSLLPPENATGNFVKVVQRLPVRIRFDPGQDLKDLRPGMSVLAKVRVR
ncbi:MAG TPA: HlyD family secretion protein [Thermoanaerobaculia bacterium]|jgi:membrane fusion protein (multidrug efflux system)|nr:HlyD family secretion protein [Thermoanaerobaculia bacterium]